MLSQPVDSHDRLTGYVPRCACPWIGANHCQENTWRPWRMQVEESRPRFSLRPFNCNYLGAFAPLNLCRRD